jgi:hypothetical protein
MRLRLSDGPVRLTARRIMAYPAPRARPGERLRHARLRVEGLTPEGEVGTVELPVGTLAQIVDQLGPVELVLPEGEWPFEFEVGYDSERRTPWTFATLLAPKTS